MSRKENEEFVTFRKHDKRVNMSISDEESFLSSKSENVRTRSLPDLSTRCDESVLELKEEICTLKKQLETTCEEINKLIIENNNLKMKITDLEHNMNIFNKVTSDPFNNVQNVNISTIKKPHRRVSRNLFTPKNKTINTSSPTEKLNPDTSNIRNLSVNKYESSSESPLKKKLFILGGQQCVDLASQLIRLRHNTQFEHYDIFSFTKPYAKTEEIVKYCYTLNESRINNFILCVGENDTNVTNIFLELAAVVKLHKNSKFFILNVNNNKYINKFKLNSMLKTLCYNTPNCNFIHCLNVTKAQYHVNVCKQINLLLDSEYYEQNYIKNIKTIISGRNSSNKMCMIKSIDNTSKQLFTKQEPKIGTIPYYFKTICSSDNTVIEKSPIQITTPCFRQ